ncbi:MAG: ribonuclease E/G, partial [Dongiaceae bacterium]
VIKRRQILLVQVTKEERGNKGAALTTYLSLAGRYCVLMPNTDRGGGISRRITNAGDRKRLKSIIDDLDAPEGMAVIVRTAGSERSKAEVKRDFEYLIRLWDEIRDVTLRSTAPALIYEEASLIKRSIRDLYTSDIGDIIVAGDDSYRAAKSFMRTLTPSHAKRVQLYRDNSIPLFQRYQIESQLAAIHQPVVQLKSGGYIVINQTEALVAVDVNSGRSTKERNIEETALRTNQEAAEEVARQLRLRDLAGLIVIDFIDMEENRNNAAVERRLKESLKNDRARIQIGRISSFGLLEMSRQRLHPSLAEASTEICPHCAGTGRIRSVDSTALHVLRMVEEEITRSFSPGISVFIPTAVALYILNQKRSSLSELEQRRGVRIYLQADDSLIPPDYRLERIKLLAPGEEVQQRQLPPAKPVEDEIDIEDEIDLDVEAEDDEAETEATEEAAEPASDGGDARSGRRRRRRRRGSRGERFRADEFTEATDSADAGTAEAKPSLPNGNEAGRNEANRGEDGQDDEVEGDFAGDDNGGDEDGPVDGVEAAGDSEQQRRRRRRGRRGGRRRTRRPQEGQGEDQPEQQSDGASAMQAEGEQDRVPTGSSERTDPAIAGFGDQPSLPETLPPHWQQATFPSLAERPASDVTEVAQIETLEAVRVEETAQAEGTVRTESGADQASGTPAAAEEGTEPAAPRRRARREDGERAPRTRKPRKSREETAAAETASADIAEAQVGAVEVAKPASADADSDATTGISEAPEPATPPAPRVRETAIPYAAAPDDVAEAPAAAAPALSNQTTSAPITVTEAPDNAGAPAVTVLDQQSNEDNDGEPKRRGWWRRLME